MCVIKNKAHIIVDAHFSQVLVKSGQMSKCEQRRRPGGMKRTLVVDDEESVQILYTEDLAGVSGYLAEA